MTRRWGQSKWIKEYFLHRQRHPFPERMSMRQTFYVELPRIYKFVPEDVKRNTDWGRNFYNKMCEYCSDLFLEGRISYRAMNIYDDSGASQYIYQHLRNARIPPPEECNVMYPIEVWVENNSTYNCLAPMFTWPYRKNPGFIKLNLVSGKGFVKSQQLEALRFREHDVEHILALNDFDPSGWCMATHDLQNRIDWLGLNITVHWMGVRPEQIPEERRQASLVPFKKSDSRAKAFVREFGEDPLVKRGYGYEIQALVPSEIRKLVRGKLSALIGEYYDRP